jgi:hypothetical protein
VYLLRGLAVVTLLAALYAADPAPGSSLDPVFATVPFDRWLGEAGKSAIHWSARILPVELSNHQRLLAKVEIVIDGLELERRRGTGEMLVLVQFSDSENRVYQTHADIDLSQVKEGAGKSNFVYTQDAFVTPGEYQVSLAIVDSASQEHSTLRLPLHVNPLKNDPLPDSWRDLPPVEIPKTVEPPESWVLPDVSNRVCLRLNTQKRIRIELLVNASPVSGDEYSRPRQINNRSLADLIPALKVIAGAELVNGELNAALLDLTTQKVLFDQAAVHSSLDWAALAPALKQNNRGVIDVHALENRQQNAQFFVSEVRKRITDSRQGDALPILIVLSGPMAFGSGADLHAIDPEGLEHAKVFYIRYHSYPPREAVNPFMGGPRRGRRMGGPGRLGLSNEPIDSLEQTLKPLRPHLFDVSTPEQLRKALRDLTKEISQF